MALSVSHCNPSLPVRSMRSVKTISQVFAQGVKRDLDQLSFAGD